MMARTREERLALYDAHPHVAGLTIKRWYRDHPLRDDLLAVAEEAVWQATADWQPAKSKFITHAVIRAHGACMHYLRDFANAIRVREERLAIPVIEIGDYDCPAEQDFSVIPWELLEGSIPATYRKGLRWLLVSADGHSHADIAKQAGYGQVHVSRCIRRAQEYLRADPEVREWAGVQERQVSQ